VETDQKAKNPAWYSIKQAADYLGVTEPTIYRWMRDGSITYRKIGDSTRFLQEDLDSHVQVFRRAKDADQAREFCPICHHNQLVRGRVQSTGRIYFYLDETKFWTAKTSDIDTEARMCSRCGAIIWFGDVSKLIQISKQVFPPESESTPPAPPIE
jgi:excisionase family DNA binding protein